MHTIAKYFFFQNFDADFLKKDLTLKKGLNLMISMTTKDELIH